MVELRQVCKRFGRFTAIEQISLLVEAGEFLTLLGPSGCGKTTLLRLIGGFDAPTEGSVWLDGEEVTHLPPYRRNVNQVFQGYALFPHLTAADNIGFGLRMKKLSRAEVDKQVEEVVDLFSLSGLEHQFPNQLSGGQQQRVALARAIVCRPKVLLLDEPLAALDAQLRRSMQIELKRLQKSLGITFIFVTHDQDEALAMSDRIAVVNRGRIEQIGTAAEIYHHPLTSFVAGFIGQANLLEASVIAENGAKVRLRLGDEIELVVSREVDLRTQGRTVVAIRPEKISLQKSQPAGSDWFPAIVEEELFKGPTDQLELKMSGGLRLTVLVTNEKAGQESFRRGDRVWFTIHPDDVCFVRES